MHSRLLRETVLADFAAMWPERFTNVTNGVTPRRFVALANPRLAALITEAIGDRWVIELERLQELEPLAEDAAFRARWREVKQANKRELAEWLRGTHGIEVDPRSMFDAQCKRIHEYKRQHLNLLHALWLLARIRRGDLDWMTPRTLVFGGKAAPGYRTAKLIIRLAHAIAESVARDPAARGLLRVAFVPDFNVKIAQRIYPAADLSEQISTAGKEASGTGNMKFALNGALTIGTLDGANVEIRDAVGAENFFLFGMTAEEVARRRHEGYDPREEVARDPELGELLAAIGGGALSPTEPGLFAPLVRSLLERDEFMVLADFRAYVECQHQVSRAFADVEWWTRASIFNVARCARFSSDRAIRDYAREVWAVDPVQIDKGDPPR
jgi:starch phosphorylase